MDLRDRIRVLANSRGLSLPKLESELGFGNGTIVKWDKSIPNVDKLTKVANYFDVSVDYLLGREKNNTNEDGEIRKFPTEFINADEAREYVAMHQIFSSDGFELEKLSDDEVLDFGNALLEQMKMVSYKFKK